MYLSYYLHEFINLPMLLLLRFTLEGIHDATLYVFDEYPFCNSIKCMDYRMDLGEDIDAILLTLYHPLDALDLPFDPPQSRQAFLMCRHTFHIFLRYLLIRRELVTTLTELNAIAIPAIIGLSKNPVNG